MRSSLWMLLLVGCATQVDGDAVGHALTEGPSCEGESTLLPPAAEVALTVDRHRPQFCFVEGQRAPIEDDVMVFDTCLVEFDPSGGLPRAVYRHCVTVTQRFDVCRSGVLHVESGAQYTTCSILADDGRCDPANGSTSPSVTPVDIPALGSDEKCAETLTLDFEPKEVWLSGVGLGRRPTRCDAEPATHATVTATMKLCAGANHDGWVELCTAELAVTEECVMGWTRTASRPVSAACELVRDAGDACNQGGAPKPLHLHLSPYADGATGADDASVRAATPR